MKKHTEPLSREFTKKEAEDILKECREIEESCRKLKIRAQRCLIPIKVVK